MKKILPSIILALVLTVGAFASSAQAGSTPLSGWAWSSNIGWISFNSDNIDSGGGSYKVIVSTSTVTVPDPAAALSGYAWSSNIGWVSFEAADVANCPSSPNPALLYGSDLNIQINPCSPALNLATGAVTGWARVRSSTAPENGGGWIQLSGLNHTTRGGGGVTIDPTTGLFSGFGFEPSALGWIDFAPSIVSPGVCVGTCGTTPPVIPPGQELTFRAQKADLSGPEVEGKDGKGATIEVPMNTSTSLKWNIENMAYCAPLTEPNLTQWNNVIGHHPTEDGTQINRSGTVSYPTTGDHRFQITCYTDTTPQRRIPRIITVHVTPPPAPLTCSPAPAHASVCDGSLDPITGSLKAPPNKDERLHVFNVCPPATETYYCTYVCDTAQGYSKKGNTCTKSSVEEI